MRELKNPDQLAVLFEGRDCYGGLDLSATTDITALALLFPIDELVHALPWFWIPADNIRERSMRDRVPYGEWVKRGFVATTPGEAVDYRFITRKIIDDLAKRFEIRRLAFDRWGAAQVYQELMDAGLQVVQMGQGYASMSAPTKQLEALVLARRLRHYSNPVLRWMAECTMVSQDPAGNVKPCKPERGKSSKRIDGVVATIMALDQLTRCCGTAPTYSISWI